MQTLEDYIYEMENRSAIQQNSNGEDLWTQLQQKENDLVLAAELGKALLEKNEELKKQHDETVEEFCKKLEFLIPKRTFFRKKKTRELCPNVTCPKPESKWDLVKKTMEKEVPPIERCQIQQCTVNADVVPDPDFSDFEGEVYRTCGSAYVVQNEHLPSESPCIPKEDRLLMRIEANLDRKNDYLDTFPEFTSVEQRMIDLNERKLHPLYKLKQSVSHKRMLDMPEDLTRRFDTDGSDQLPKMFEYNQKLLDQKNICFEYKRMDAPDQMTSRLLQMRQRKKKVPPSENEEPIIESPFTHHKSAVFHSLYQKNVKY
ncbi:hypothetical protein FQA39_LY15835 [Lamprigera yunnana]|nr:hypothetical protein FQA39_LY15835 [Lamprigera yunnana]